MSDYKPFTLDMWCQECGMHHRCIIILDAHKKHELKLEGWEIRD